MHTCVIIDDDQLSIDILKNFITRNNQLSIHATFTDPIKAINEIAPHTPIDFLFLDIRMDISGIDVARVLRDQVKYLIFVTAYEEYAIDAFGVNCDQYLVKPITYDKFQSTIEDIFSKENRRSGLV